MEILKVKQKRISQNLFSVCLLHAYDIVYIDCLCGGGMLQELHKRWNLPTSGLTCDFDIPNIYNLNL